MILKKIEIELAIKVFLSSAQITSFILCDATGRATCLILESLIMFILAVKWPKNKTPN